MELEDFEVLRLAETLADEIWHHLVGWEAFVRDTVGGQLARAVARDEEDELIFTEADFKWLNS